MTGQTPGHRASALALRIVRLLVVVVAMVQLGLYLELALRTVAYPFPLEWMEGGTVDVVERVVRYQPIYTQPTAEYVPYIYPPLYYWVSAQLSRLIGIGFLAPRLVSFASVCGVFVLIAAFIRRSGGDWIDALAGAALFAGTYDATERWFHLARVDSLFLALLLAAAFTLQSGKGRSSAVAAGVLLFLACLTKQTTLIAAVPLLAIAALGAPRRPLIATAVFAALVGAISLWMNVRTGGWWMYFLYWLPQMHPTAVHGSRWFWRYDMIPVLPAALAVTGVWLAMSLVSWNRESRWIAALCAAGIVASWSARLHSGGAANSLMPAYAALAVAMPIGVAAFRSRPWLHLAGATLLAVQLALLLNTWNGIAPTASDRDAGMRYLGFLRGIDGEVLAWHQRFVSTLAGKRSWGLEMAAEDVIRGGDAAAVAALQADVIRVCRTGEVAGVIDPPEWLRQAVVFGPSIALFNDPAVFRTVAGAPKRPERYFPIASASMHQPDQPGGHHQVEAEANHPERPAAK
jgi:4-amino-4-deoxy-L-arabinose transferase-like glycosyltransferase